MYYSPSGRKMTAWGWLAPMNPPMVVHIIEVDYMNERRLSADEMNSRLAGRKPRGFSALLTQYHSSPLSLSSS